MRRIVKEFKACIQAKKYSLLVCYGLFVIAFMLLLCTVIRYIGENLEAVVVLSILLYFGITIWNEWKNKRKSNRDCLLQKEIELKEILEQEQAEQNYVILQRALFITLGDINEVLKIKNPQFLSELVAPTKTFPKGNTIYYQFCCLQSGEGNIDTTAFVEILQQRISQKLMSGEIYGIVQSIYIYEGKTYPLIQVVDVEKVGINLYITLVIVNEEFCKEERMRAIAKQQIIRQQRIDIVDKDF